MPKGINTNLVGHRFDKLLVMELVGGTKSGRLWLCRCDCGNTLIRSTGAIKQSPHTGCKQCESKTRSDACPLTTHGLTKFGQTRLYRVWKGMRKRCNGKNDASFKYYGAKGIRVCDEWSSFPIFHDWAFTHGYVDDGLPKNKNTLAIDRIDPTGNYEPKNCRFITISENSRRTFI